MKARQPELRAIPQFDAGRWKLRLERVPLPAGKQSTMSTDFDSAAQPRIEETECDTLVPVRNVAQQTVNHEHPIERVVGGAGATGASDSKPIRSMRFLAVSTPDTFTVG